jgi:brefeldin A-inhibited guanine nucleotide-exchange protein
MVLRSLVAWSQQGIAATLESTATQDESYNRTPNDDSPPSTTPNKASGQGDPSHRFPLLDDPEQFEALKYRKTALQDAIQKFNFKPKKVTL